jgi:2-oxo-4-hydroxy-4-carboxy--5-ureidoimidazoline (OHCU) decarboxylase
MTRLARKPMDKGTLKVIARLLHLHHQTHPDRLAEMFDITPFYVRKVYSECPLEEFETLRDALQVFIAMPGAKLREALKPKDPREEQTA